MATSWGRLLRFRCTMKTHHKETAPKSSPTATWAKRATAAPAPPSAPHPQVATTTPVTTGTKECAHESEQSI